MKEKYLKIINHFGIDNQIRKLHEEELELIEAILDYEYDYENEEEQIKIYDRKHLIEELADVTNLLNQIKVKYGINEEELKEELEYKVNRTLERIGTGFYE